MARDYTRKVVGRAAAILTTSEVAGSSLDLAQAHNSQCSVYLTFTLGSLTSCTVKFYASEDGSNYRQIAVNGGALMTESLTGNSTRVYAIPNLSGMKKFRMSVQGVGTATGSSCAYSYHYLRKGSQI